MRTSLTLEELAFRLYDVFAPARAVSGLVAGDRRIGFVVVNAAIISWISRAGRAPERAS